MKMLRFIMPLVLTSLATGAKTVQERAIPQLISSAASDAQIRFAIENKYDDTGPGAKTPEYAYRTYKTLEEALVGYIDDPDTKLPEYERNIAIQKLVEPNKNEYYDNNNNYREEPERHLPKTVEEYTGYRQKPQTKPIVVNKYSLPNKNVFYQDPSSKVSILDLRGFEGNDIDFIKNIQSEKVRAKPGRVHKIQPVRSSPLNLAHFARIPEEPHDEFNPHPQYTFSYGVHDKHTGDSKSAHETRDGDIVRGFYTFIDADGKQRTVHYTADEKQGFRATVQRTQTNAQ